MSDLLNDQMETTRDEQGVTTGSRFAPCAGYLPNESTAAASGDRIASQRSSGRDECSLIPYYRDSWVTIYHGDCYEIAPRISASLVMTDPPYNVGINYGEGSDDSLSDDEYKNAIRKLKACCAADWVVLLGSRTRTVLPWWNEFDAAKMIVVRVGASVNTVLHGFRPQFRVVLTTRKSSKWWSDLWEDVRFPGEGYFFNEQRHDHPCHAPLRLMTKLSECLAMDGDVILDPFMGSGTTLVAAKNCNRRAIGIEVEERYCELAAKRLSQEVFDFTPAVASQPTTLEADERGGRSTTEPGR